MKTFKISKKELEAMHFIGQGFESKVYLFEEDVVFKIFSDSILQSHDKLKSKKNKLIELSSMKEDTTPKIFSLLYDEEEKFIGYSMEYIQKLYDFEQIFKDSRIDIKEKINLYKLLEKEVLYLAEKNIFMVDNNFRNFCIDKNEKIRFFDFDSVTTLQNKTETYPTYFTDYYFSRFDKVVDYDFVKYTLNMQFLYNIILLINPMFDKKILRFYTNEDILLNKFLADFKKDNEFENCVIYSDSDTTISDYITSKNYLRIKI